MHQIAQSPVLLPKSPTHAVPLTSIVVVCYNQAQFLRQALQSALAQTYENLEIIVVDDGSTDSTPLVCAGFPGILYVYQSNQGLASARNTGLRHSLGDYVAFLDADDRLLPNAIHAGVESLSQSPRSAFTFGTFRNICTDGSPAPTKPSPRVATDHYLALLQSNFIGMHGAVLYRRKLLAAAGGFNESLRAGEDYELYLRLARTHTVCSHDTVVAEYRRHEHNMSRDHAFMLRSVLQVLDIERRHLTGRVQRRALRSGCRIWRSYYGELLLRDWTQQWGSRAWKNQRAIQQLVEILCLWPAGVLRQAAASLARRLRPPRAVRFGTLRRLSPFSRQFGFDRGQPIDRYYVETFLKEHARWIRGRVLEIGDDYYSRTFGASQITHQDILHVNPGFAGATIIADLADAPHVPDETFDCIILTQTLHYIFDLRAALATLRRILKAGGILLVTLPGISQICRDQNDRESDCWRFTQASATRLFASTFDAADVRVQTYGNVLAAVAFLEGLAVSDLRKAELDHHDPDYQVTIAVTAIKGRN